MKKIAAEVWKRLRKALLYLFLLSIFSVILYRFIPPPVTPLMLIRCNEQLWSGKKLKLKKDWTSLKNMSPAMPQAVMASEDQLFTEHRGFDTHSIKKAFESNNRKKKKGIKGASTISQQVAKNVFLWPARSWLRKGLEVYFTELIEIFWSKKRIMEVYLNVIETGDGIYGAEEASRIYFKKPAKRLTANEAALIAAILPNPRKWRPTKPTAYIHKRQEWILFNMKRLGNIKLE